MQQRPRLFCLDRLAKLAIIVSGVKADGPDLTLLLRGTERYQLGGIFQLIWFLNQFCTTILRIGNTIFRGATKMRFTCPVCGYKDLPALPRDYEICPSCGTEFEYHDALKSHEQLRREWKQRGLVWHSRVIQQPSGWNGYVQLIEAHLELGKRDFEIRMEANTTTRYVTVPV